ncbi:enoyl-CoA hydratase/isomerase family protein [Rhodococcus sp. MSC1_016]|uniref:enoyl-CoA hydratase/isomerase family protein n=1 Tax=Rhodococcus sp. MSC1_016 TaxID=2909266 RepID=UPI00202DEB6E|nr:enoyl-CoA hydratase/isomerase family protein [Rhodococcus sp. MSC1_016]
MTTFTHANLPTIDGLTVTVDNGVAVLAFDRPHRRNALHRPLLDGLAQLVDAATADDDVRVLLLTGRGGAFCAGGDLDALKDMEGESADSARARMRREFSTSTRLVQSPKPTIAAIGGAAVGAGAALALACDVRIGSPSAFFAAPFVSMALVPDFGASWLLAEAAGAARAKEIAMTGRRVGAEEALRIGLLHHVADDPDARAWEMAVALAAAPVDAVRGTKALVAGSVTRTLEDQIECEIDAQVRAVASPSFAAHRAAWARTVRRD